MGNERNACGWRESSARGMLRGPHASEALCAPADRFADAGYGWFHAGGKNPRAQESVGACHHDVQFGGKAWRRSALPEVGRVRILIEARPPIGIARSHSSRA